MMALILILSILNTFMIVGASLFYFFQHYTIIDTETFNQMVEVCQEAAEQEEAEQELPGGGGFFTEQLEDCTSEEEDDE